MLNSSWIYFSLFLMKAQKWNYQIKTKKQKNRITIANYIKPTI